MCSRDWGVRHATFDFACCLAAGFRCRCKSVTEISRELGLATRCQPGALERRFAMWGESHDLDDGFAGAKRAVAVDDRGLDEAEACDGALDHGFDLVDGQIRVAFEHQRSDRIAGLRADEAGESHCGAGAGIGRKESVGFLARIERRRLDAYGHLSRRSSGGRGRRYRSLRPARHG